MQAIPYRDADFDGQQLFYREAGPPGAPTVVLLHGFPASSFMFRDLIPLLGGYHVIAPDHLGFGLSAAPPAAHFGYTFDALAGLTAGLLGQLGITRYAMYVQDYGAPVGWRLALADPGAVTAIITQNGNGYEAGFVEAFWKPVREYCTPTCVTAASRCWRSGAPTTRSSAPTAPAPSPPTRPGPRSTSSPAATSCSKATWTPSAATSAASLTGRCHDRKPAAASTRTDPYAPNRKDRLDERELICKRFPGRLRTL